MICDENVYHRQTEEYTKERIQKVRRCVTIRSDALFDPDGMKKEKKESGPEGKKKKKKKTSRPRPTRRLGDTVRRNHMADRIIQPEDFRSGVV